MQSDEPIVGIGALSGQPRFTLGEPTFDFPFGKPEKLTVKPMATGGTVAASGGIGWSPHGGATGRSSRGTTRLTFPSQQLTSSSLTTPSPVAEHLPGFTMPSFGGRAAVPQTQATMGAPAFTGQATAMPVDMPGQPAFAGQLTPGRSLAEVFARAQNAVTPRNGLETIVGQAARQHMLTASERQAASTRVKSIINALQNYTSGPRAERRRLAGIGMMTGG